jgi:hypothetical protein
MKHLDFERLKKPRRKKKDCFYIPQVLFKVSKYLSLELIAGVNNSLTSRGTLKLDNFFHFERIEQILSIFLSDKNPKRIKENLQVAVLDCLFILRLDMI